MLLEGMFAAAVFPPFGMSNGKSYFFSHTCSYSSSLVRSFGAEFVTMALLQIFNALTKTLRERLGLNRHLDAR
jgi:hypothetical protein